MTTKADYRENIRALFGRLHGRRDRCGYCPNEVLWVTIHGTKTPFNPDTAAVHFDECPGERRRQQERNR